MFNYKDSSVILLYYQIIINFEKKMRTQKELNTCVGHLGRISQPTGCVGFAVKFCALTSTVPSFQNYVVI